MLVEFLQTNVRWIEEIKADILLEPDFLFDLVKKFFFALNFKKKLSPKNGQIRPFTSIWLVATAFCVESTVWIFQAALSVIEL